MAVCGNVLVHNWCLESAEREDKEENNHMNCYICLLNVKQDLDLYSHKHSKFIYVFIGLAGAIRMDGA